MLDEYVRNFRQRNPNLHLFNAVMHLDEASPHLHLNVIPFYTKPRQRGMRIGVSMKQALIEQGCVPQGKRSNQLIVWEQRERDVMEEILHRHGVQREDKQADYKHLSVEDYKLKKDREELTEILRKRMRITDQKLLQQQVRMLENKAALLEQECRKLEAERHSPFKLFFYRTPEQQSFVQEKMQTEGIPYHELENGFEARDCYVKQIRKIEKQYIPPKRSYREILRNDVDCLLMQSQSIDELLDHLKRVGYAVKQGNYLAVKPKSGENFIRLQSLGEAYSEIGLRNRLHRKARFEKLLDERIQAAAPESASCIVWKTLRFYTVTYTKGALPMCRRDRNKPYSWENDAEVDKLLALNRMLNEGATLQSLQKNLGEKADVQRQILDDVLRHREDLKAFHTLKEQIEVVFDGKSSDVFTLSQAKAALSKHPNITRQNYRNIDTLIESETAELRQSEAQLAEAEQKAKEASELLTTAKRVFGETYVQHLVHNEQDRRLSAYVPNGLRES